MKVCKICLQALLAVHMSHVTAAMLVLMQENSITRGAATSPQSNGPGKALLCKPVTFEVSLATFHDVLCMQALLAVHMTHVTAAQPVWMRAKLALTASFCTQLRGRVENLQAELAASQMIAAEREMELLREAQAREEMMCDWTDEFQGVSVTAPCSAGLIRILPIGSSMHQSHNLQMA